MQDLLNEEEFIAKKNDYNPWRRFGVFYGIAAAIILTYFVYIKITGTEVNDNFLMIIILGIPALLTFLMVFTKKDNYHLSWKLILLGVEGLMATCYITLFPYL